MKLSIIIPFYNVELYIEDCLNSIVKQIDEDDEIILINDGSTDSSLQICKDIKKQYFNKIKLINKSNEGIAIARNLGLSVATGKYIVWIDADDWVSKDYITCIKECLNETDADILLIDYCKVARKKTYIYYADKSNYIDKAQIMKDIAQDSFSSLLWRTIAKKSLYIDIKFPLKIQMMEDFSIYHKLFYNAMKIFYLNKAIYYYRIVNNSLSHIRNQDIYSRYNIALQREMFFKNKYPNVEEKYRIVPVLIYACPIMEKKILLDTSLGNIRDLVKKYIIFLLSRRYINKKKKFQFVMITIYPKLLGYIRCFYEKTDYLFNRYIK